MFDLFSFSSSVLSHLRQQQMDHGLNVLDRDEVEEVLEARKEALECMIDHDGGEAYMPAELKEVSEALKILATR